MSITTRTMPYQTELFHLAGAITRCHFPYSFAVTANGLPFFTGYRSCQVTKKAIHPATSKNTVLWSNTLLRTVSLTCSIFADSRLFKQWSLPFPNWRRFGWWRRNCFKIAGFRCAFWWYQGKASRDSPSLNQDIGLLVQDVEGVRKIFQDLKGQLPADVEATLLPAAFIEGHQHKVLQAKQRLSDRASQASRTSQREASQSKMIDI